MIVFPQVKFVIALSLFVLCFFPKDSFSQTKRIAPPKRPSKIESVDQFVDNSFSLYHKIFVYDSLSKAGVEIPTEVEDAIAERAQQEADSLWQVLPTVLDDMTSGDDNIFKKGKATINLNKSKKALRYCMEITKAAFFGGTEAEIDDDN